MKVLLADRLPEATMTQLQGLGLDVETRPELGPDDLPSAIGGAHVLVVRSTKVTAAAIDAADTLQLIIRAGAGTNTIDIDAAARRAVHVCNCPGKNAVAVAELTLGLILALDRSIPDNVMSLRAGRWEKKRFGKGRGLHGRTLGVIGMGRIGQAVVARAQAFGMVCVGYDVMLTEEGASQLGIDRCDSVPGLCARSDVVTIHVPHTDQTHHLLDEAALAAIPDGGFVVNAARGGVVDDQALLAEVVSGRLRAASDVYEDEPKGGEGTYDGLFREAEGFYGTHHIGASTAQAQQAIGDEVTRIVRHWLQTGEALNCVNRRARSPARGQLLVRHLDRVGVLARVLDVIRGAEISVKDMQNTIFDDTGAAVATITLERPPGTDTLTAICERCPNVLGVEWVEFDGASG
ncbi:MAG: phosphoglycerate dehydrogenase [Myxococcota bacterium]|nr:phosphoglycerate dehydrogenase [Myxococcota bacterium]